MIRRHGAVALASLVAVGCFGGEHPADDVGDDAPPDAASPGGPDAEPLPPDATTAPCPAGYTRDDVTGTCYRFGDAADLQTWFLAEALCELDVSEGIPAHLVVIDDATESARVAAMAGGTALWIGLTDHVAEGTFLPVNGAPAGSPQWESAQPDDADDGEDCVGYAAGTTRWTDRPCSDTLRVVCEFDGRVVPEPPTYCDTTAPTDCGACGDACLTGEPCAAQACVPVCPAGYEMSLATSTCYKLVTTPTTWQAAELDCEGDFFESIGSHLAVVESAVERDHLYSLALGSYWIGGSDHELEGTFRWVTGAAVSFADWGPGEPNDDFNTEDCLEYRPSGGMVRNDRSCSALQRYFCEWDGTPADVASPTWCDTDTVADCGACGNQCPGAQPCQGQYCQPPCPVGFTGAIGSCYRLGATLQSWQASETDCESSVDAGIPAHLAVVTSQDERAWLDAQNTGGFWIGLSDHDVESSFRWITGAPVGPFLNWGSGEPNNDFNTEDCVEYRESTDRWNDRTCSAGQKWACEWDGVAPATGGAQTWCDTDTNQNCGACGNACIPGLQSCVAQVCQSL